MPKYNLQIKHTFIFDTNFDLDAENEKDAIEIAKNNSEYEDDWSERVNCCPWCGSDGNLADSQMKDNSKVKSFACKNTMCGEHWSVIHSFEVKK